MEGSLTGLFDFTSIVGRWVSGLQGFWNILNKPVVDILNIRWVWFFATEQVKEQIGMVSLLDFILYASLGRVAERVVRRQLRRHDEQIQAYLRGQDVRS